MLSKKQFVRRVKKEKCRIKKIVSAENVKETLSAPSFSGAHFSSANIQEIPGSNLADKLKSWFIENKPTVECTNQLLKILKSEQLDVPSSVQGLIGKTTKCLERTVSPGTYVHIGLNEQLVKLANVINDLNLKDIEVDVGIDGLPLFKSSAIGLWPILGRIVNIKNSDVFIMKSLGSYIGKHKPADVNVFLHDFVHDVKNLNENGLTINGTKINVHIRVFICDSPAKSFICGVKGHMAYNGCAKCQQVGQKVDNVVTYSTITGEKRTDEGFKRREYKDFHNSMHANSQMELESIGIGMISQFPIDFKLVILSSSSNANEREKANIMLKTFVEKFPYIYGQASVSYNIHCVLHLVECVEQYGSLNNFSAYPFENFMKKIKKKIKMPKHLPQQLFNVFSVEPINVKSQFFGLKYKDTIERQNNAVCEVLAEHSASLKTIISSFWNTPKYIKQFPIKSEESLCKWEDDINEENKNEMTVFVTVYVHAYTVAGGDFQHFLDPVMTRHVSTTSTSLNSGYGSIEI
ncbi:hypothetical protein CVS40_7336 [Lucilia cuprina]|nr:hypothetical protein CVS40_7336 [Lucilia cuprina]